MTSPLILSLPDMNNRWALAFPATRAPKSASESVRVTANNSGFPLLAKLKGTEGGSEDPPVGLSPRPLPTSPLFLRSMCQLSVSPAAFLRTKAKTALPCLMASLRSASLAVSALLISSKAAEAGNLSAGRRQSLGLP